MLSVLLQYKITFQMFTEKGLKGKFAVDVIVWIIDPSQKCYSDVSHSYLYFINYKIKYIYTFAASETVSQLPPLKEKFPLPIRNRISSGVSLGPLAKGVYLGSNTKEQD